ncbi:MAG: Heat-inducible transcription repressor hrcA [Candidatus Collierbacteria bacterium GW2011_GWB1_44_6]|uniref:Heat-inducible transcription repressor HrcA n=2 Tax=Candidatus Collieribacteriota TaxID=1752725 RepID=A0A0G1JPD5_9BACT|nr:MAG: Heat-inducible transcription repressor hrcA [Candidatus Collierbacteria bacterium GW2011_GWC2_43_12]KKT73183.1 MAG: Heat-inducible transcription repressor hrcA [Candidatus Collierbacteria bacterium GW2011_GWB1_44_6]KKT83696.1 MAG: Heat-inducible transcription repressor hrcA [Microgenomates group bacterium GW2011_GWC1_44_9]
MDLTERQILIIKTIVEEFTESAEPVGSVALENKYRLGVSPATLRNEMASLEEKGFLSQPHASSGRIPTPLAIKFYVNELMKEKQLSVAEEVGVKSRVWDHRFNRDDLLHEATKVLAERTKALCVAAFDEGQSFHSGYANIFNAIEFKDLDITREIFYLLDEQARLMDIFGRAAGNNPIHILVGDEMGVSLFQPVSCVFADIHVSGRRGSLGIIGPSRQEYDRNIPFVRYVANLVNQIAGEW